MIAHRIAKKSAKDSFVRLGCYVLDITAPTDPRAFDRLAGYVVDHEGGGERVMGARITNCGDDDIEMALDEIARVQAQNTTSKSNKAYHLVISFPEGERPTLEQLRDIEEHLVAAIGLEEHQRISAIHDDTDNLHIHVAINKVHPTRFRNVEPFYDKRKLMSACRVLELKHGLAIDNHGLSEDQERKIEGVGRDRLWLRDGAAKMEAHGGRQSLTGWIADNAKSDLMTAAVESHSWAELHVAFAEHGLELRQKGAGLAAGVPSTSAWVKASSIDRSLSFNALTKRLGMFVDAERSNERSIPNQIYTGMPSRGGVMAGNLYTRFEQVRITALGARSAAVAGINQAHVAYSQELREYYRKEKAAVRARYDLRGAPRKKALGALEVARQKSHADRHKLAAAARAQARRANPLPTWQKFLEGEVVRGDEAALSVLRARVLSRGGLGADILTARDVAAARHVVYQHLSPQPQKNGDIVYNVRDGGQVTDRATEVRTDKTSAGAVFLALSLAADRFVGRSLVIDGSDAFKAEVVQAAAVRGLDVRFSNPEMELAREACVARGAGERIGGSPSSSRAVRKSAAIIECGFESIKLGVAR